MTLELDHIVVCVPDLEDAGRRYERDHGVKSVQGGRHQGHGTANRVIPLGANYVELVAVVDPEEARASVFGSWVTKHASVSGANAVCLRTDSIEEVGERLHLKPTGMSRITTEGVELRWWIVGLEQAFSEDLPFFIEWNIEADQYPGRIPVEHPAGDVRLGATSLCGDRAYVERLHSWAPEPRDIAYVSVSSGERSVRFRLLPFTPVDDD